MKPSSLPADPRLTALLADLLSQEQLPPLDRWFSATAKRMGWPLQEQKRLWDSLRRALTRAYGLVPNNTPEVAAWPGFRIVLRGRAQEWARIAGCPSGNRTSPRDAGIPGWLSPGWDERRTRSAWTDSDLETFLRRQEIAAPVYVRYRWGPAGQECRQRLRSQGLTEVSEVEGIDRLTGGQGVVAGSDWTRGLVEIQDASSQLSLVPLALRPGMKVWDVCAGQGGKTLLAAGELRGKGLVVATDVVETKRKHLKERLRRSGWQNVRILAWDGEAAPDFGPEIARETGFDRVIVDAPCSASGTWRRDPEGRFRLTPRVLGELQKHQQRLIRIGWRGLKPGGRMAYITCSWLPEENERIVEAFVQETGARVVHQELLGLPAFDANSLFVATIEKP